MGSVLREVNCPKCGFERAMIDYYYKSGEEYVRCYQCGYASDLFIDKEKTKYPDKIVWKHEENGGRGCYFYKTTEMTVFCFGPVVKGAINAMKNKLDEFATCKYSYKRKGKWFIKDLLSKKTEPFSYNLLFPRS